MTTLWRALFAANLVLLALLAVSVPALEPGSGSYVVALLSGVIILASLVGLGVLIRVDWNPF